MKFLLPIIITAACLSFLSCKNTHAYDKYIKELDSLKIVVQQSVDNFKTVDSASCVLAYARQYTYSQFITTHLKDTVSKTLAENLQNFQSVEKGLHDYLAFRSEWLAKSQLSITQLQNLAHDLKNGSINEEEAVEFINTEKKQAETIIEELKLNTELIRKHLDVFNQSLPACEELVKQLNSGTLPELLKPEVKHLSETH
ncbi:MAG: hypothetical protein HY062_12955 [Bacteroidetes bacterium]|nr:hypothetical protein [Bacteroidota bacterium]